MTDQSDPAFLSRITVNYIRHALTAYDKHLREVAGRIGVSQAIGVIRRRGYAAIRATYPEYAEECQRQIQFSLLEGPSCSWWSCTSSTELSTRHSH